MKDKTTAAVLAFFLGGIGVHKFYLNKTTAGIIYLIFCWTLIPAIIAFVEFIMIITMNQHSFDEKYNSGPDSNKIANNNFSKTDELDKLFALKEKGAITQEEFNAKKKQLL